MGDLQGAMRLDHICECFSLHWLWFQHIKASCMEPVALIKCVCFCVSSQNFNIGFYSNESTLNFVWS